jgi:hypothetical protein
MSGNVLGERELIRRISEILGGVENDDCAVIDAGDRYLWQLQTCCTGRRIFPIS